MKRIIAIIIICLICIPSFAQSKVVTGIANTQYGNLYINDGTGEVYVYGTLDKDGKEKNFLSLGIEVGDIITVEGPKDTYNGTVELEGYVYGSYNGTVYFYATKAAVAN